MRDPVTSASLPFSTTCRTTMSQHSSGSQHKAVTEDERLLASPSRERRAFTKTDSLRVLGIVGVFVAGLRPLPDVYNAVTSLDSALTTDAAPSYADSH